MPLAVAIPLGVAALGAASKYGAATSQSRAMREAAAAQERSSTEALGYQKGRDTISDQRYMDAWNDYKARHAAWEQRNFGAKSGGGGGAATTSSLTPMTAMAQGDLTPLDFGPDQKKNVSQEGATVADLGPWNDWRRYGISE